MKKYTYELTLIALALAVALLGSACTNGSPLSPSPSPRPIDPVSRLSEQAKEVSRAELGGILHVSNLTGSPINLYVNGSFIAGIKADREGLIPARFPLAAGSYLVTFTAESGGALPACTYRDLLIFAGETTGAYC